MWIIISLLAQEEILRVRGLNLINVANLMINTRQKSKAKERLDFLVGQINNRTNNIYKLINSKLKKELPYAPLKISTATNTSNVDSDDMEFQIIQP